MAGCSSENVPAGHPPSTPYGTFIPHSSPLPTAPPLPSLQKATLPTAPLLHYPPKAPLQYQSTPQPAGGYHAIPVGYQFQPFPNVVDGIPMNARVPPLPFCGIGVGWALFVVGFLFASIPWYVGAFILLFVAQDHREKPGLIACSIAAGLTILSLLLNAFNFHVFW
ncbi:60S ribosomal protein L18a-like protein [Zingiber officinale]|nr:60S ribosomal protein L18a-like protein [Zingiber officinale]